ncbi:MAG: pyridoxamine 5'-phosphate oxidase family protein [Acutalibacteraceae bacterium]
MFRAMRRHRQQLSDAAAKEILIRGIHGVLAVAGDGGYPYAVPLSYVYQNGEIYFHCAAKGHKLDAIGNNDKVSFCVVGRDETVPERYTAHYTSVIVFGRARILDGAEKINALRALAGKYCPNNDREATEQEIAGALSRTCIVAITPEHITGKQARELVNGGN